MDGRSHEYDVIVTLPDELDARVAALTDYLLALRTNDGIQTFREVEQNVRRLSAGIECAATAAALRMYESDAVVVEVNGRQYQRLGTPNEATYICMAGGVRVPRHLYREVGVRNGPTIVPLELNAGIVEGLMTPEAAQANAYLTQALPSREAKETADRLGVLPLSRTSIARVGNAIGARWEANRIEGETHVISEFEVPIQATAVSVSVDRVRVPMEEARPRRRGRPRKGAPKRPVEVVYRMAYCAVLTLHNAEGEPLRSIRYGRMPTAGASLELLSSVAGDLAALMTQRPQLRIVTLADGAPEMQRLLDQITHDETVFARLIDFWHLIEKLAAAIAAAGRHVERTMQRWKKKLKKRANAIEQIEMELKTWALDFAEDELPAALYNALTYIENNRDRMRYANSRAENLPIGSGHVEATCKTIVSTRMKRCGARWKYEGGQAVMHLRALATSSLWDDAMAFVLGTYRRPILEIHADTA